MHQGAFKKTPQHRLYNNPNKSPTVTIPKETTKHLKFKMPGVYQGVFLGLHLKESLWSTKNLHQ